jgi:ABC-type transport system involved in multi-copper enzyme maturation permease subunit
MTRLVRAELLKLRRRWASYIVLAILLGLMTLVYVLVGLVGEGGGRRTASFITEFPGAFGVINSFVFGLGGLLAVAYAAAIAGADWNWGVMRVVIARGESRSRYVLAKALGLAIALAVGTAVAYAAGIALTYLAAAMLGTDVGNPFAGDDLTSFLESVGYGYLVLLQRAALGFAVAMLLRSQLAGVVVGIVLYIGETILSGLLVALSIRGSVGAGMGAIETQWFQFLPFSIGDSVLAVAPSPTSGLDDLLLTPVAMPVALAVVGCYLAGCVAIAMLATERAEIAA